MGAALARAALRRRHAVTIVTGPVETPLPSGARVIRVEQAEQMRAQLRRHLGRADALIMAAAVCDFRPAERSLVKLPRAGRLNLSLVSTADIVGGLPKRRGQIFVGFALETGARVLARATKKLASKHLDVIVAESVQPRTSPFGDAPLHASLVRADGTASRLGRVSKARLAAVILDELEHLWYVGGRFQRPGLGAASSKRRR